MERFALLALMGSAASGLIRSSAAQALSYIRLESCALVGEPSVFTSHSVGTLGAEQKRAAPQGAAYSCLRLSKTQAIRAVLLAKATVVRLKPRRATSAFSQVDCRSSCLADRLTTARAPWTYRRRKAGGVHPIRSAATTFWRMPMPSAAPTRARRVSTARILRTSRHTGSSDGWLNWSLRSGRRLIGQSQSDECIYRR